MRQAPPNIRTVKSGSTVHDCDGVPLQLNMSITLPLPPPLCRSSAHLAARAERSCAPGTSTPASR